MTIWYPLEVLDILLMLTQPLDSDLEPDEFHKLSFPDDETD